MLVNKKLDIIIVKVYNDVTRRTFLTILVLSSLSYLSFYLIILSYSS